MTKTTTVRDGWSPFFLYPTETATLDLVHLIPIRRRRIQAVKGLSTKKDARCGRPSLYRVLKKVSMVTFFAGMDFAVLALVLPAHY